MGDLSNVQITAGLGGFITLFLMALAIWWLGRDMTRRLRRIRLQEQARLAEEQTRLVQEQDQQQEDGVPGSPGPDDRR